MSIIFLSISVYYDDLSAPKGNSESIRRADPVSHRCIHYIKPQVKSQFRIVYVPENYTHSLLDISLPLCYNDDNINERSNLKWPSSLLIICIVKNYWASSSQKRLLLCCVQIMRRAVSGSLLSCWSLKDKHRLHTAGGVFLCPNDGIWHTSLSQTQVFESSSLSSGRTRCASERRLLKDCAGGERGVTAGLRLILN